VVAGRAVRERSGATAGLRLPTFGSCPLEAIDGLEIRRWVAGMHAEGLSVSRIQQSYRQLSQLLSSGIDCGLLDRNPTHGVKLPRASLRDDEPHHRRG
jgi:hypothetical protein